MFERVSPSGYRGPARAGGGRPSTREAPGAAGDALETIGYYVTLGAVWFWKGLLLLAWWTVKMAGWLVVVLPALAVFWKLPFRLIGFTFHAGRSRPRLRRSRRRRRRW